MTENQIELIGFGLVKTYHLYYAIRCEEKPSTKESKDWTFDAKNYNEVLTPCKIYITN